MAFKMKQGRSEFSKTGRGITSKLAGPEDPANGDLSMPSTKKINYTGGKSAKEYNTHLKDSLASQNLPIGNYTARFHEARQKVKGAANQGNISKEKASSMTHALNTAEFDALPLYSRSYVSPYTGRFEKHNEGNKYRDEGESRAERILMDLEKKK